MNGYLANAGKQFMNNAIDSMLNRGISLYRKISDMSIVNGIPFRNETRVLHWTGQGSFQPARLGRLGVGVQPKFNVYSELRDTLHSAYLPYEAMPEKDMVLVIDSNEYLIERKPNLVAGLGQHWQCFFIDASETGNQDVD